MPFTLLKSIHAPEPVYPHAADMRAYHGLKTQDALHLATAIHHRCAEFWTNDNHLAAMAPGLVVNLIERKQPAV
ncbi:MAG: PIN domain-containing protein [Magnetococcales bacterium]|nr:PIN domain-containing protein [Magnetococcales bacterium]